MNSIFIFKFAYNGFALLAQYPNIFDLLNKQ